MNSLPHARHRGTRVLITGGTQGLGLAVARRLAQEGAEGIVISGRRAAVGEAAAAEIRALGTACHYVPADVGVADVREMVRLRARAKAARLDLHEVADPYFLGEVGPRSQPGIRPDFAALADARVVEHREREELGARGDFGIAHDAVRPDPHAVAEHDVAFEDAIDVDRDVAPARKRTAHVEALDGDGTPIRIDGVVGLALRAFAKDAAHGIASSS